VIDLNTIDINIAYNYCKNIAINHYENFPVASLLFPKDKRKYVYAVYAFARTADDIADSPDFSTEEKIKLLDEYESTFLNLLNLNILTENVNTNNIMTAVVDTIREFDIPESEFLNLLKAFKQDSVKNRYIEFEELLNYSALSANPIGHLVLYISGYNSDNQNEIFKLSDKICTALQLTNFWQDVSVDLKMNRIYIPISLMDKHHYDEEKLKNNIEDDNFKNLMSLLVEKTQYIFNEGKPLTIILKKRLRKEFKVIFNGGMLILKKIEQNDYKVLSQRLTLSRLDKLNIMFKVLAK
jgi:squalene synthase HpnC